MLTFALIAVAVLAVLIALFGSAGLKAATFGWLALP